MKVSFIMKWVRKIIDGVKHRKRVREIQKKLEKGEDPFTY